MYLSSSLSLSLYFSLFFCWSGRVFSSLWPNVSKIALWRCSLNVFVIVFAFVFALSLSFCWSGHASSPLWSNVSIVKSPKDRSFKVFSKCICHCLCICLCRCFFVGQVMFPHHSDQMSQWSKVTKNALWRCSLNVFVIVIVSVFVFVVVFLLGSSCFRMTPSNFARFRC